MHNLIITVYAAAGLLAATLAYAGEKCVKVYGKTVAETFAAAAQLAASKDAELGGENCLNANTTIHILPEKENGLYVAELHYTPRKGTCPVELETQTEVEEGRSP